MSCYNLESTRQAILISLIINRGVVIESHVYGNLCNKHTHTRPHTHTIISSVQTIYSSTQPFFLPSPLSCAALGSLCPQIWVFTSIDPSAPPSLTLHHIASDLEFTFRLSPLSTHFLRVFFSAFICIFIVSLLLLCPPVPVVISCSILLLISFSRLHFSCVFCSSQGADSKLKIE